MPLDFGWKKKAERLRMVILSAAHQLAKELPPGLLQILELFRRAAETKDGSTLMHDLDQIPKDPAASLLWEPAEIYGWLINATMYRREGQLWWLVHAARKNEDPPRGKDVAFLDKVLDHLGAVPDRHVIIGPRSSPASHAALPFGWWTWQNRAQLYEIQVNEHKRGQDTIRIVPLGSRETDGYRALPSEDPADALGKESR